jgi:hypothetical protein
VAKITAQSKINFEMTITISEAETRALDALTGYGDTEFIKAFKEFLGEYYLRDHEQGLKDFFKSIRQIVPGQLSRLDAARKEFLKA